MIFAIVAVGYRPSTAGIMPAAEPVAGAMVQPMAMPDCRDAMVDRDCCDGTEGQNCAWEPGCVARCHINACVQPVIHLPPFAPKAAQLLAIRKSQTPVRERRGIVFRPPIV
jgi:hypothetical protein